MSKSWYIYVHEVSEERSPDNSRDWGAGPIRLLLEANLENAGTGGGGGGQRGHGGLFWPDVHCVHKVVVDPSRRPRWKNTVRLAERERERPAAAGEDARAPVCLGASDWSDLADAAKHSACKTPVLLLCHVTDVHISACAS